MYSKSTALINFLECNELQRIHLFAENLCYLLTLGFLPYYSYNKENDDIIMNVIPTQNKSFLGFLLLDPVLNILPGNAKGNTLDSVC